ncbi:hypothetical protein D9M69_460010 [compost metagenome]
MRVALQVARVVDRVERPADQRPGGAADTGKLLPDWPHGVAGRGGMCALAAAEQVDVDAGDARGHHQQRPQQP